MPLQIGTHLGPYEVTGHLGAGGMGEVYRARDPRLGRDVAIKVLHASVESDADRLRRFITEAQAVAALNHPNILTIYESGGHEGHPYLVTELLDGQTLRERLDAGALPFSKAIDFARQTAAGLAAAHAKGIAHRDVKPENLFITTDGRLKILDFGLAKTMNEAGMPDATRLQTATAAGMVLGTVGYMAPEQVRAQPADQRADIFSLGVVLYEMLTGRRPFMGESAVQTMNAILTEDPPEMTTTGRTLSPAVSQVVKHCLEKNPEERFQSARDLAFSLQALSGSSSGSGIVPGPALAAPGRSGGRWLGLGAAALAGAALTAGVLIVTRPAPATLDLSTYTFTPFATDPEPETAPSWSRDGRSLAYMKDSRIYVRAIDSEQASPVTSGRLGAFGLFWFPDGARLGFIADGGVYSVSRAGGDPERIQEGRFGAAALSPDGHTLAVWKYTRTEAGQTCALWIASPISGPLKKYEGGLGDLEALSPTFLHYSPDGKRLIVSTWVPTPSMWLIPIDNGSAGPATRLFANADWQSPPEFSWMPDSRSVTLADRNELWLADVERESMTRLTAGVQSISDPNVSPDGHRMAFVAGTTDFDLVEIPVRDEPVTDFLASGRNEFGARWLNGTSHPGEVAFLTDKSGLTEIRTRRLADGSERVIVNPRTLPAGPAAQLFTAAPSPDGSRVLYTQFDGKQGSAWIAPMTGGAPVRVGPDTTPQWEAAWSPDGKEVAYVTSEKGVARLMKLRVGSSEPPVKILDTSASVFRFVIEWSPAGDWIAFGAPKNTALVSPDGKTQRNLAIEAALAVAWSPDGRTIHAIVPGDPESPSVDLVSVDVATGRVRTRRKIDPKINPAVASNPGIRLSLNAEGTRLLTSVSRVRADIWILER